MASCVSCSNGSALVSETMLTKTLISPIRIVVIVPSSANNRISRIRVRASKVDSSSDFVRRTERACNQGQSCVHLVTQKGILNANGVGVLVFLFLVITCFVKSHPETLPVLFALERDQCAALIVKEQAFVQSGWKNLLLPSSKTTSQMVEYSF